MLRYINATGSTIPESSDSFLEFSTTDSQNRPHRQLCGRLRSAEPVAPNFYPCEFLPWRLIVAFLFG